MAEQTVKATMQASKEEEVVVATITDVPEAEESPKLDSSSPAKPPVSNTETTKTTVEEAGATPTATDGVNADEKVESLREDKSCETETVDDQESDNEKKALVELKLLLRKALNNHEFSITKPTSTAAATADSETRAVTEEAEANTEDIKSETQVKEAEEDHKKVVEEDESKEASDQAEQKEEVKKVSIDEDGTKTVEAIEETVVSVVPSNATNESSTSSTTNMSSPLILSSKQKEKTTEAKGTADDPSAGSLPPEEVSLWGVPLLQDERTDTILWKFLRARDFQVKDAFGMIKNTIRWRKDFGIDELVEQELEEVDDLGKAAFMYGVSKEGNPVCYNVYGAFQDKELYHKTFSDEQKRGKFLKWRIQLLERSVRKLNFSPGGVSTIVQVNDLKNSPGPGKWELRQATKQALHLLQDNYPEFVAKQVFINVPWWYVAVNKMLSPFLTQRTKSKFVVAGPSKSAETLFNYIAPEQVPVQYGGLSTEGEFGTKDGATQIIVKPTSKETVEFAVTEACHLTWEMRVLGWEVSYGAEFVPNATDGYTVIIQKNRKVGASEESIITNTFNTSEPGKLLLTIHNASSKKKRLLYRLKSKPTCV